MYNKKQMFIGLIVLSMGSMLNSAAETVMTSAKRVLTLMVSGDSKDFKRKGIDLKVVEPALQKAIELFKGTQEVEQNFAKAQAFIFIALKNGNLRIRNKALLLNAAIFFAGKNGMPKEYESAKNTAEMILKAKTALASDLIRAFVLLDEIVHSKDGLSHNEIIQLRAYASEIADFETHSRKLSDELCYRIARLYSYDESGELSLTCKAAMCLNTLTEYGVKSASLHQDITTLRYMLTQKQSMPEESGGRSSAVSYCASSVFTPAPHRAFVQEGVSALSGAEEQVEAYVPKRMTRSPMVDFAALNAGLAYERGGECSSAASSSISSVFTPAPQRAFAHGEQEDFLASNGAEEQVEAYVPKRMTRSPMVDFATLNAGLANIFPEEFVEPEAEEPLIQRLKMRPSTLRLERAPEVISATAMPSQSQAIEEEEVLHAQPPMYPGVLIKYPKVPLSTLNLKRDQPHATGSQNEESQSLSKQEGLLAQPMTPERWKEIKASAKSSRAKRSGTSKAGSKKSKKK